MRCSGHARRSRLSQPRNVLGQFKFDHGDLAGARELRRPTSTRRRRGQDQYTQRTLGSLFDLEYAAGRWPRAEGYLDEHAQLAFDGDDRVGTGCALAAGGRGSWTRPEAVGSATRGRNDASAMRLDRRPAGEHRGYSDSARRPDQPAVARRCGRRRHPHERRTSGVQRWVRLVPMRSRRWSHWDGWRMQHASFHASKPMRGSRGSTGGARRRRHDVAPCCYWRGETRKRRSPRRRKPQRVSRRWDSRSTRGRPLPVGGEALRRLGRRRHAAEKLETAREIFAHLSAPLWLARVETRAQPGEAAPATRLRADSRRSARGCTCGSSPHRRRRRAGRGRARRDPARARRR